MRRITCRRSGSRSSRASSTAAGTSTARRPSRGRSSWASFPQNAKLATKPADIKDWDKLTRRREAAVRAADGSVRGVRRAHRLRDRPRGEGDRRHGRARQHADHLRGGRQRRQRRRRHGRHVQRDDLLQRRRRDGARHAEEHRQVGRARDLPAHGGGLGGGRQHAVHVDQAGGRQLRRHAQSAGRQLAGADQGQGRDPQPVPARGRHRADRARSGELCRSRRRSTASSQTPMEGVSMVYTFDDAKAAGRHKTQYFEIFGNRAIYHDGWVAATVHKAPWEAEPRRKLADDVWELYNVDEDFSETNDLAAQQSGQAQGAAGALHEGSRAVPRAADRRPVARTVRPGHGGPSGPDGRPQVAHGLRRHDRA